MPPKLIDFSPDEEAMIQAGLGALAQVGYDVEIFKELTRVDMPPGYRAMTLELGAILGAVAFGSQELLNHVLEEEYLHLVQKAQGQAREFGPGTALELELDVHEQRKFPAPG
jgi:hypothetical protein